MVMDSFEYWMLMIAQATDDRYFEELVSELVKLLAAKAGAVWLRKGRVMELKCQHVDAEFSAALSDKDRRTALLRQVVVGGESVISHPPAERETNGNLLMAVPVKQNQEIKAVVEIVQLPGASAEVQQDNLRLLERVCKCASGRICKLADVAPAIEEADAGAPSVTIVKKRWWEAWKK